MNSNALRKCRYLLALALVFGWYTTNDVNAARLPLCSEYCDPTVFCDNPCLTEPGHDVIFCGIYQGGAPNSCSCEGRKKGGQENMYDLGDHWMCTWTYDFYDWCESSCSSASCGELDPAEPGDCETAFSAGCTGSNTGVCT